MELYLKHYQYFRKKQTGAASGEEKSTGGSGKPPSLEDAIQEVRRLVCIRHYAYRTEQTYLGWLSQYGRFVQKCQLPWDMPDSARAFLGELAMQRGVSASSQNQAFSALLFLLREV